MLLEQITPLLITYNEAPNIGRTLGNLTWAKQVVVVDSFSDDETLEIMRSHSSVTVYQREFCSKPDHNFHLAGVEPLLGD